MNSLSVTRIHEKFTMNTLSISRIHLESTFHRLITINSLSFPRFYIEIIIIFPKSPSIYYRFRDINNNSLFASTFHNEFTVCFVSPLFINIFRQITIDSLSATRNHYEYTNRVVHFSTATFFSTATLKCYCHFST